MDYEELKKLILDKTKSFPQYKERAIQELVRAKIAYSDGINLVEELNKLKSENNLSDGYIIPFFLGLYEEPKEIKPIELKQTKSGGGGGLDIDTDLSTAGKPLVKQFLEKKYGKDRICSVGTYRTIGLASAIKDILRYRKVNFSISNKFCSELNNELSFEENMSSYQKNHPDLYHIYEQYKPDLDFVPKICNMIRSVGKHAGGLMILDSPIYECLPVVRPQGELATAFCESGSLQELDELGYIKFDMLAISQLDTIDQALDMAEEEGFFKIEDDDGIIKIVSKAYLLEKGITEEEINNVER